MGYHTDFSGEFTCTPALTPEQVAYLKAFNETRRMRRNTTQTVKLPDPKREAVGLPVGIDGGYFVGAPGFMGEDHTPDVTDHNRPPSGQPGLWCQWTPSEDGTLIVWDEGEKFYDYVDWIKYLITHFLTPWGVKLNGTVDWAGEEQGDIGKIIVENNSVRTKQGHIVYDED